MNAGVPADDFFCALAARFWHPVARSVDVAPGAVLGDGIAFDYADPSRDPTVDVGPDEKRPIVGTNFEYRPELPFAVALANASGPGRSCASRHRRRRRPP